MTGTARLGPLRLPQLSAPPNPSSGQNLLYPKSDGKWYGRDSAGVETLVGPYTTTDVIPTGALQMFAGDTAPTGWLLCNTDTPISRTTYAALFAVIGTTYGFTDSTNFKLPNLSDRFPIGASATKPLTATPGGSATKTIGATNLPNHTHSVGTLDTNITGSTHTHQVDVGNATPGTVNDTLQRGSVTTAVSAVINAFDSQTAGITGAHTHGVIGSTGNPNGTTGVAMDVMNPWLSVNFIIKT